MEVSKALEIILLAVIVLNIADALITTVALESFSHEVEEGNPVTKKLLERYEAFLIVKGVAIPLCLGALAFYIHKGHGLRTKRENKIAIGAGIAAIVFYLGVIINNMIVVL